MTEYQQNFLIFAAVFFAIQAVIFLVLYIVLIVCEKRARIRHAYLKELFSQKRKKEMSDWSYAYKKLSEKNKDQNE